MRQAESKPLIADLKAWLETQLARASAKSAIAIAIRYGFNHWEGLERFLETANLSGLDPQKYLADVLTRIADHPARQIAELLPWHWKRAEPDRAAA